MLEYATGASVEESVRLESREQHCGSRQPFRCLYVDNKTYDMKPMEQRGSELTVFLLHEKTKQVVEFCKFLSAFASS